MCVCVCVCMCVCVCVYVLVVTLDLFRLSPKNYSLKSIYFKVIKILSEQVICS